jgi:6-phosphogluconolactonase
LPQTIPMRAIFLWLLVCCLACSQPSTQSSRLTLFIGTYTQKMGHVDGKASGIYTCTFDLNTGRLQRMDSTANIINPSFLCVSPNQKYLYAVSETGGTESVPFGFVYAYQILADGKLLKINEKSSYGVAPCHVSTDRKGEYLFVANYGTGNLAAYRIQVGGGLSDSTCSIQHPGALPWAHMVMPAPDNESLWAVDKGADQVFIYQNVQGRLNRVASMATSPGAGPRHLDFHPTEKNVFALINESNSSMYLCKRTADTGPFQLLDSTSTLPADFLGVSYCADVHFHPNGRFLYGSNRGHNSIVRYRVDLEKGQLTDAAYTPSGGAKPRNFMITPDGAWLLAANQDSGNITVFKIDPATGALTQHGAAFAIPTPVCIQHL